MREVELWEAVALSLNLEPCKLPVYLGAFDILGDDPFRICPPSFIERLLVANSNCGISLRCKPVHKLRARSLVDLPAFGAWAVNLNLPNMPPELVVLAATEPKAAPVVVESAFDSAAPDVQSGIARQANKSSKTKAFEKAACEAMTDVWNDYKFNKARDEKLKEPTKGEMHSAALNKLIQDGISSKNKNPTVGMVCDATKKWKKPAPMPVSVPSSVTPKKRHPFKADR